MLKRYVRERKRVNVPRTFTFDAMGAAAEYVDGLSEYNDLKARACEIVIDAAYEYLHMWYMNKIQFIPVEMKIVFLIYPPQITVPEFYHDFIDPEDYIHLTFFNIFSDTVRKKNLVGCYVAHCLYSHFEAYTGGNVEIIMQRIYKKLPEELKPVLTHVYHKYRSQGLEPLHALRLARRDVIRVAIANMWLLWTAVAYKTGLIKTFEFPIETTVCTLLTGHRMINPIECLLEQERESADRELRNIAGIGLSEITWIDFLKMWAEKRGYKTLDDVFTCLKTKCMEALKRQEEKLKTKNRQGPRNNRQRR